MPLIQWWCHSLAVNATKCRESPDWSGNPSGSAGLFRLLPSTDWGIYLNCASKSFKSIVAEILRPASPLFGTTEDVSTLCILDRSRGFDSINLDLFSVCPTSSSSRKLRLFVISSFYFLDFEWEVWKRRTEGSERAGPNWKISRLVYSTQKVSNWWALLFSMLVKVSRASVSAKSIRILFWGSLEPLNHFDIIDT